MGEIDYSFRGTFLDDRTAPRRLNRGDVGRIIAFLHGRLDPQSREEMLALLPRNGEDPKVVLPILELLLRSDEDREVAAPARPRRLVRPPGSRLLSAAQWLLPPKDAARIVGQAVADMREEHAQALADGCRRKAQWIEIRDSTRIFIALAQRAWHAAGKFLLGFFKIVS